MLADNVFLVPAEVLMLSLGVKGLRPRSSECILSISTASRIDCGNKDLTYIKIYASKNIYLQL